MLAPCCICQRQSHFRVEHLPDGKAVTASAPVCSLACLGIWIYRYGILLSRQAVRRLLNAGKN